MPKKVVSSKDHLTCVDCFVEFKSKVALKNHACVMKYDPAMEIVITTGTPITQPVISTEPCLKCLLCNRMFKNIRGLKIHMNKCHSSEKPVSTEVKPKKKEKRYVCGKCPHVCASLREYRHHMECHNNVMYNAGLPINFVAVPPAPSANILSTINVTPNIISNQHECPNCLEKFDKIGSYRRHLRRHLNIYAYKCKHCLISYFNKSELVAHMKQVHHGEKKETCNLCDKKFYHSSGLIQHRSEHLISPPYQCFLCDAVFPSTAKQVLHITNHATVCCFCKKPFANSKELWKHTAEEHDQEDEESDASDAEDSDDGIISNFNELDVESDADSYTSVDSDSEGSCSKKNSPKIRRVKGHVCFVCERRFPKQLSLDLHMQEHKIHSCMACPKFFTHPLDLKHHQQEHLESNSSFYSKVFDDLQSPLLEIAPVAQDTASQGTLNETANFIMSWYSGFKDSTKFLKYPISIGLHEDINQMIGMLASMLYRQEKVPGETKDSFVKIYNELTGIISKNAEHIH